MVDFLQQPGYLKLRADYPSSHKQSSPFLLKLHELRVALATEFIGVAKSALGEPLSKLLETLQNTIVTDANGSFIETKQLKAIVDSFTTKFLQPGNSFNDSGSKLNEAVIDQDLLGSINPKDDNILNLLTYEEDREVLIDVLDFFDNIITNCDPDKSVLGAFFENEIFYFNKASGNYKKSNLKDSEITFDDDFKELSNKLKDSKKYIWDQISTVGKNFGSYEANAIYFHLSSQQKSPIKINDSNLTWTCQLSSTQPQHSINIFSIALVKLIESNRLSDLAELYPNGFDIKVSKHPHYTSQVQVQFLLPDSDKQIAVRNYGFNQYNYSNPNFLGEDSPLEQSDQFKISYQEMMNLNEASIETINGSLAYQVSFDDASNGFDEDYDPDINITRANIIIDDAILNTVNAIYARYRLEAKRLASRKENQQAPTENDISYQQWYLVKPDCLVRFRPPGVSNG